MMPSHSIFRDRDRLSPSFPIERHWKVLPHRVEQTEVLWSLYGDILDKRGDSFLRVVQVMGPAGSGKSSSDSSIPLSLALTSTQFPALLLKLTAVHKAGNA